MTDISSIRDNMRETNKNTTENNHKRDHLEMLNVIHVMLKRERHLSASSELKNEWLHGSHRVSHNWRLNYFRMQKTLFCYFTYIGNKMFEQTYQYQTAMLKIFDTNSLMLLMLLLNVNVKLKMMCKMYFAFLERFYLCIWMYVSLMKKLCFLKL